MIWKQCSEQEFQDADTTFAVKHETIFLSYDEGMRETWYIEVDEE